MAIVFALEISIEKDWLKEGSLIVESDSKVALTWVRATFPWNLRFCCNKLTNLLYLLKNVTFIHRTRESNHFADNLAKEGASLEGLWVKWSR